MKATLPFCIENLKSFLETKPLSTNFTKDHLAITWIWHDETDISEGKIYCFHQANVPLFTGNQQSRGMVMWFNRSMLQQHLEFNPHSGLFNTYHIDTVTVSKELKKQIIPCIEGIVEEYNSSNDHTVKQEVIKALLQILLLKLQNNLIPTTLVPYKDDARLASHFLDLVQENFMNLRKVSDYADRLFITPNYLNIKIKKVTGFTASYHIQQRVLLEARKMALTESTCLKDVAYGLGFEDLAHFSKYFKNGMGMNFSAFQKAGWSAVAV